VRYVEHADARMDLLVLLLTLPYSLGARKIGQLVFGELLQGIDAFDDEMSAARAARGDAPEQGADGGTR